MDEKWGKLDNILSELWKFFVPPILNTIILLIVFPNIPRYIWEGISIGIKTIQNTASSGLTLGDFDKVIENINKIASITDIFSLISNSAISAIITFAILIFILHKTVLLSSRIIFGEIQVRIDSLEEHCKLKELTENIKPYLPPDLINNTAHEKWKYSININDSHEELGIYKGKRKNISIQTNAYKEYAMYSIMYSLMAIVSLAIMFLPEQKFSMSPLITLVITSISFIYFARNYLEHHVDLVSTDMRLFIDLEKRKKPKKSESLANISKCTEHSFLYFLKLFDNHIFDKISNLFKGVKHFTIDRKYMKSKNIINKPPSAPS